MSLFRTLGFRWDRENVPADLARHSLERVCFHFHRTLPDAVWNASVREGNPLTFPEVKTLTSGVTVGGRRVSDQAQVLNLIDGFEQLLAMVKAGAFVTNKAIFTGLHRVVARNEALEWGNFQGEGQAPSADIPDLDGVFHAGIAELAQCEPFENAVAFFLFCALQQFFYRGNKRTSQLMMNGILMSNGMDAISVPAAKAGEYHQKMRQFLASKDATQMMAFLLHGHPGAEHA